MHGVIGDRWRKCYNADKPNDARMNPLGQGEGNEKADQNMYPGAPGEEWNDAEGTGRENAGFFSDDQQVGKWGFT